MPELSTGEDENGELTERPSFSNNYKQLVAGPWVVGVNRSKTEVRFFIVNQGKVSALTSIISNCCELGTAMITEKWREDSKLN